MSSDQTPGPSTDQEHLARHDRLGLALLLFAAAVLRTAWVARPIAYVVAASPIWCRAGWSSPRGFSATHTILILVAWVLSLGWMIWLVVVAWRMQDSEARRLSDEGVRHSMGRV
jgi:hypothetical protein